MADLRYFLYEIKFRNFAAVVTVFAAFTYTNRLLKNVTHLLLAVRRKIVDFLKLLCVIYSTGMIQYDGKIFNFVLEC